MKYSGPGWTLLAMSLLNFTACLKADCAEANSRPRVIISTDIGGADEDDYQSMVHYLVHADRFETEGLVSSSPGAGRAANIIECLDAYEADYANLKTWADYPAPEYLRGIVRQGAEDPQPGPEPETVSDGARLIIERAQVDDPRPLHVLVWGSITDVAQAVKAAPEIKGTLRIISIGSWNTHQDPKARNYLFEHHPDLWWIENDSTFRGMYMGGEHDEDLGNTSFPETHVAPFGALGKLFAEKKLELKMGDTPTVLYLLWGDPDQPEAAHWGGAFVRPFPEERPTYWTDNPDPALRDHTRDGARTVNRWRTDYLRDWQTRMARTVRAGGAESD